MKIIKKIVLHLNNRGISQREKTLGNKGFSLIELIVTIAIMAIFVAVAIISSSVIDTSRVQEVERGIDDYANMARSKSMSVSAYKWYMEVTTNDDGEFMTKLCKVEQETDADGKDVYKYIDVDYETYNNKVTVTFNDGITDTTITKDCPLRVYFDSATGKVNEIDLNGTKMDLSNGIGRIKIVSGTYDATLKFYYNTGKIERE